MPTPMASNINELNFIVELFFGLEKVGVICLHLINGFKSYARVEFPAHCLFYY